MSRLTTMLEEWLPRGDLRRLVAVRGLRSFVQGYIMVVFSIYLGQIGFPAWLIGLTLTIGGVASALLTLVIGVASDRFGRRRFLLIYSALLCLSGLLFSLTTIPWLLITISAIGGLGRGGGGGGAAGAFAPAEQAMIADKSPGDLRRRVFAVNSVVGTALAAFGALLSGIPEWLQSLLHLSLIASYRPLYLGVAVAGALSLVVLWPISEPERAPRGARDRSRQAQEQRRETRRRIGRISIAGAINGFGLGFTMGIVPYWLHLRFGVSAGAIGPVISASNLLTALGSLLAVRLAARFGDIHVITGSRLIGVALTAAIPIAPVFPLAALLYGARMISSQMAMPVRQSYTMGIIESGARGSAAGISGVTRRLPASASPTISGYWIGADELGLPFYAAALCLAINAFLYYWWFHDIRPMDDPVPAPRAAAVPTRGRLPEELSSPNPAPPSSPGT